VIDINDQVIKFGHFGWIFSGKYLTVIFVIFPALIKHGVTHAAQICCSRRSAPHPTAPGLTILWTVDISHKVRTSSPVQ
jgi:hypothetical protein